MRQYVTQTNKSFNAQYRNESFSKRKWYQLSFLWDLGNWSVWLYIQVIIYITYAKFCITQAINLEFMQGRDYNNFVPCKRITLKRKHIV